MTLYEEVAAEGRWIAGELPIDREAREAGFRALLDSSGSAAFVAEADGAIVGTLSVESRQGRADLGMMVASTFRRQGVGSSLMEAALVWAGEEGFHKISLEVWPHNEAAIALYERFGFVTEGRFRRHYRRRDGSLWDALRMGLVLDDASPGSPFELRREGAALELAAVLARECVELLGPELVAVVLHGSLVLGEFDPLTSDVDLLVVTVHALDDEARRVLADTVLATDRGEVAGLDFRVVTRDAAAKPVADSPMELYVGVHHDAIEIEMTRSEPDLLVEFSVARDHGLSLVGPGAAAVIGPVPSAWILNYSDLVLERWQELVDDDEHGELMVFTACRIWRYAEEGVHSSKIAAAHWALRRDPSLAAVQQTLLRRGDDRGARIDPRDLSLLLQRVRRLCAELSPPVP